MRKNEGFKIGDLVGFNIQEGIYPILEVKENSYIIEHLGEFSFDDRRVLLKIENTRGNYGTLLSNNVAAINLNVPLLLKEKEEYVNIINISEVNGVVLGKTDKGERYYL